MPRKGGLCDPEGPLGGASAGYALYRTKDGWVALAALEPRFVERLTATLKIPSLSAARLRKIFAARTSALWESWGERHGIPVTRLRRSGR
jgi:crotonobetainyl-CoA:carnitine CoA-transferase CaiB-like acyl-CoA transferase